MFISFALITIHGHTIIKIGIKINFVANPDLNRLKKAFPYQENSRHIDIDIDVSPHDHS
ncbi:MAG: hypothetical protein HGA97_02275 [Chlorobiaceae bacterium]|nr:hypothetical protein [Chlorobiaceae bacterium]